MLYAHALCEKQGIRIMHLHVMLMTFTQFVPNSTVGNTLALYDSIMHLAFIHVATLYVTVYGKFHHIRFSMKIKFGAYLISSTMELSCVQVSERLRASLWSYSAVCDCAPPPIIEKLRSKGVAMQAEVA